MTFRYENKKIREGYQFIIGSDEVGRGSLAGPVVAAAVVLPISAANDKSKVESYPPSLKLRRTSKVIKDSKLLLPKQREELSAIIKSISLAWSIGEVSPETVDEINIHNASLLAMKRAIENLLSANSHELALGLPAGFNANVITVIDGRFTIANLAIKQQAVVDADDKILSVAAASIVAKVYRDNLMRGLHEQYPIYNFARHKGYATEYHRRMIISNGLSAVHRKSFCEHLTV